MAGPSQVLNTSVDNSLININIDDGHVQAAHPAFSVVLWV